ncbi:hypothetical protein QYS49_27460 [Marivirga salinae]|uniref:Uncharacterized protein n=1 Tax=Marivirga salinarum TaxID=3059078 RepID=A0AA49GAH5_9BACT|nr:hypothetical protein [Marivirga sp. BDSF4-3]WKK75265.2 hypothetical protein QYS49_27460 [Marivirga sp. BDSF4-3]
MQSIIDIDKESFKTQLIELKKNLRKDSFGFIKDFNINFNNVEMVEDTFKVTRNANMLNPFRGTGQIIGQLNESNKSETIIDYIVKPEISLTQYYIFLSLFFAAWLAYSIYLGDLLLSAIGLVATGLIFLFIYLLNRFQINSLNNYFQKVLNQIKTGSNIH